MYYEKFWQGYISFNISNNDSRKLVSQTSEDTFIYFWTNKIKEYFIYLPKRDTYKEMKIV